MGAELDFYQKKTFVSLVGFLFQNTKLFGAVPLWPFHSFEEVNLRFYIRKKVGREIRRAVCFFRDCLGRKCSLQRTLCEISHAAR